MRTKRFALALLLTAGAIACDELDPDGGDNPLSGTGCYLNNSPSALQSNGQIFFPSGYALLDQFYQTEGLNLVYTFGVAPSGFYYIDSDSPNAFANPEQLAVNGPDGTVVFGLSLVQQQLSYDPSGSTFVAILAHEFGHIAQFNFGGISGPGKRVELHADYLAGWYLAFRGKLSSINLAPTLGVFYSIGDYAFNAPQHHGTPDERLAAASAGFHSYNQTAFSFSQAYGQGLNYVGGLMLE